MKTRLIVAAVAACSVLPVSADETPLGEKMEALNDAYKGFRREKDPKTGAAEARKAQDALITLNVG